MSAQNGSADTTKRDGMNTSETSTFDKGKGKATAEPMSHDMSMGEEEDSSSEDEVDETAEVADDVDEDNMEEIDTSNIVGRRTRGRQIDFAKAAQDLPEDDEDEEDDDDFEEPIADEDKMEE